MFRNYPLDPYVTKVSSCPLCHEIISFSLMLQNYLLVPCVAKLSFVPYVTKLSSCPLCYERIFLSLMSQNYLLVPYITKLSSCPLYYPNIYLPFMQVSSCSSCYKKPLICCFLSSLNSMKRILPPMFMRNPYGNVRQCV